MSDLIFKGLHRVTEKGKILLSINDSEFIVLTQQKRNDHEYVNHISLYSNIDAQFINSYNVHSDNQVINVQKVDDSFLFLIDKEYEDGISNVEPNIYVWSPLKGFYQSFYAGRYINSMMIDQNKNLWVGYDEMGIFSGVDQEISARGMNKFILKNEEYELDSDDGSSYVIDQYYSTFVSEDAIYLHYRSMGEDYIQKLKLSGETLGQYKAEIELHSCIQNGSYLYLFILDDSYHIKKAAKTTDMQSFVEHKMLNENTGEDLCFAQVAVYKDKCVGIDHHHNLFLLNTNSL
ncbi:hypothetical protein MOD48_01135 [Bacillus spizizenii]|uniref:hypothetical protein n=1 Tax=Bacillus spizizenii TaxID=96241 RepID=UPI0005CA7F2B|nr:hypothetical protein [Bacillus spizizenii]MDU7575093.1 hypothetical protein [Bacillus subtilis]MCY7852858.1 hypothetical protein [Bacillus spizizenii]MCY7923561.1 hypothetical protein [Bacillus spizizenii]MCY8314200.1 hypothetical protein [Bacillus spizizenii]MCY8411347.1 hypothetical protein [Bacillus spizizenii]